MPIPESAKQISTATLKWLNEERKKDPFLSIASHAFQDAKQHAARKQIQSSREKYTVDKMLNNLRDRDVIASFNGNLTRVAGLNGKVRHLSVYDLNGKQLGPGKLQTAVAGIQELFPGHKFQIRQQTIDKLGSDDWQRSIMSTHAGAIEWHAVGYDGEDVEARFMMENISPARFEIYIRPNGSGAGSNATGQNCLFEALGVVDHSDMLRKAINVEENTPIDFMKVQVLETCLKRKINVILGANQGTPHSNECCVTSQRAEGWPTSTIRLAMGHWLPVSDDCVQMEQPISGAERKQKAAEKYSNRKLVVFTRRGNIYYWCKDCAPSNKRGYTFQQLAPDDHERYRNIRCLGGHSTRVECHKAPWKAWDDGPYCMYGTKVPIPKGTTDVTKYINKQLEKAYTDLMLLQKEIPDLFHRPELSIPDYAWTLFLDDIGGGYQHMWRQSDIVLAACSSAVASAQMWAEKGTVENGIEFDITSMYPYIMRNYSFPAGPALTLSKEAAQDAIDHNEPILGLVPADLSIPDSTLAPFHRQSKYGWYTVPELCMLKQLGATVCVVSTGFCWQVLDGLYSRYVDKTFALKCSATTKKSPQKALCNTLWGRMGKQNKLARTVKFDGEIDIMPIDFTRIDADTVSFKGLDSKSIYHCSRYAHHALFVISYGRMLIQQHIDMCGRSSVKHVHTDGWICDSTINQDYLHTVAASQGTAKITLGAVKIVHRGGFNIHHVNKVERL